ncbi:hypothetical protein GUITHDRAFT_145081 [Guillardia theta CCMP2712]|uniref:Uncharacterized protein n=2 Tax=Guillardia theta TaxID=55529 RepID=L1INK1_GUITC|nr:hypothetical protein GUITHDRAFT_145081 [Guillardia theta CCMP2712]EKX37385.1 hypothetical protein GUITHDRAFT_145081 [Guillardia theta CCMP2712]|eukprot:XP_005824365.1 hypothetical protein GUITHDRAFT_145081 [Guillardia theta CCMP2712]
MYRISSEGAVIPPPVGMRSSSPLGGLGTGSVELRSDGSFRDWLVDNEGPGLCEICKRSIKEEMVLAVKASSAENGWEVAKALTTKTVRLSEHELLPTVDELVYRGGFPVSSMQVADRSFPLNLTLFAYSPFSPFDVAMSSIPSIAFELLVDNPTRSACNVTFGLTLPLLAEKDVVRLPFQTATVVGMTGHVRKESRFEGVFTVVGLEEEEEAKLVGCELKVSTGHGSSSEWRGRVLDVRRSDSERQQVTWTSSSLHSAQVNQSVLLLQCEVREDGDVLAVLPGMPSLSACRTACEEALECLCWSALPVNEGLKCVLLRTVYPARWRAGGWAGVRGEWRVQDTSGMRRKEGGEEEEEEEEKAEMNAARVGLQVRREGESHASGELMVVGLTEREEGGGGREDAVHASCTAALARAPTALSSCMAHTEDTAYGRKWKEKEGRDVGNAYATRFSSAQARRDAAEYHLRHEPRILRTISSWNKIFAESSLDHPLIDFLMNSVSNFIKTGFLTADGRWRQFESFSCNDEPVHLHLYRSIPLALLFPQLVRNILDTGPIDEPKFPCGSRMMGDSNPGFVLSVLNLFMSTGDRRVLLDFLEPVMSSRFGLPRHLQNTYDWFHFHLKDVSAYNAVLYLAQLAAAERIAALVQDDSFQHYCQLHLSKAQEKVKELLWNGRFLRAWWNEEGELVEALHTETLYGQLWAFQLNLGLLLPREMLLSHLEAEMGIASTKFGLLVMSNYSGRGDRKAGRDNLIWEAGSLTWSTLSVFLDVPLARALLPLSNVLDKYRRHLQDLWDWRDLTAGPGMDASGECGKKPPGVSVDGQPWCNSHYSRQLIGWSILSALSRGFYDPSQLKLSFEPADGCPRERRVTRSLSHCSLAEDEGSFSCSWAK